MKFRLLNEDEWNVLKEFEKEFNISLKKIFRNKLFVVSTGRKEIFVVDKFLYEIYKKLNREVYCLGLYIGEIKKNFFLLSLELASIIEPFTKNKIIVNEKAEQLFLYGKDIFENSILKSFKKFKYGERCLVLNKHHETLGIGKYMGKVIKNLMDRGWYLRKGG